MVMRNRHDGTNPPQWWDDLPPPLRKRFTFVPPNGAGESGGLRPSAAAAHDPGSHRPAGVVRDLTRLAVMFLAVAIANLVFLLIALSFLSGSGSLGR